MNHIFIDMKKISICLTIDFSLSRTCFRLMAKKKDSITEAILKLQAQLKKQQKHSGGNVDDSVTSTASTSSNASTTVSTTISTTAGSSISDVNDLHFEPRITTSKSGGGKTTSLIIKSVSTNKDKDKNKKKKKSSAGKKKKSGGGRSNGGLKKKKWNRDEDENDNNDITTATGPYNNVMLYGGGSHDIYSRLAFFENQVRDLSEQLKKLKSNTKRAGGNSECRDCACQQINFTELTNRISSLEQKSGGGSKQKKADKTKSKKTGGAFADVKYYNNIKTSDLNNGFVLDSMNRPRMLGKSGVASLQLALTPDARSRLGVVTKKKGGIVKKDKKSKVIAIKKGKLSYNLPVELLR